MPAYTEHYQLSPQGIDGISERISSWLTKYHESKKNCIRMRLIMEEVLLSLKKHFGEAMRCRLQMKNKLGIPSIHIKYRGEAFNPLQQDVEADEVTEQLFKNLWPDTSLDVSKR